jgi:hypothetical protein
MSTWQGWENDVLTAIGAPITAANIAFLDAWQHAEGGSATYNPLNTTQPASGSTPYNSAGVQDFTTPTQGANATKQTLENGYYPAIVSALQSGDPLNNGDLGAMSQELNKWGTGSGFLQALAGSNAPGASGGGPDTSGGIPAQVNNNPVSSRSAMGVAVFAFFLIAVAAIAMRSKKATA